MKRSALQNKQVVVLRMGFRARKVFGTFEKQTPDRIKLSDTSFWYQREWRREQFMHRICIKNQYFKFT